MLNHNKPSFQPVMSLFVGLLILVTMMLVWVI